MKQTIYSNLSVFADEELLSELQSGNLIESKEEHKLVLTSAIPKSGIEFNPDIGQKVKIDYLISNLWAKMTVSCAEKKLSKSTNKEAYQLLTFDVLELKCIDRNEELKKASEEEELAAAEVKVMKNLYNSLEKKEWNTTAWLPNYGEPEIFRSLEQKGLLRLKTFGGAFCFTPEGFDCAKRISE